MGHNINLLQNLEWDSEFFGLRIARVISNQLTPENVLLIVRLCDNLHVDCLYFLCAADDQESVKVAQDNGFILVDIRLTLEKRLGLDRAEYDNSFQGMVRPAVLNDLETLRKIARTGHRNTRFYSDPGFPNDRCDDLYETWIEKSYNGYANSVFVAEFGGQAAGYISCHLLDMQVEGQIGLLGVASGQQKMGFGKKLVNASLGWFSNQGIGTVSVVTQGRNVPAQRLYQRCGFLTKSVQLWYHRWFPNRR
jgi:dTDP-4-amino-4,6-dideoxy-D-galactose acyltransferase